jgi:Tripartite tricarboxylate transporter TctB family
MGSGADEQGAWARPVSERIGGVIIALALLAAAVFFIWQAALLPFGRVGLPGPGFFPFALGVVLAGLALVILFRTLRGGAEEAEPIFLGHRDVLIALLAMAGMALTFERVNAYAAMGAFTAALLLFVARTTVWRAALGVVLGMVAVWLFFGIALGVRLPPGEYWQDAVDFIASKFPAGQL